MKILVLGAAGYVGTQCVSRLLQDGHTVVAAGLHISKLSQKPWAQYKNIQLTQVDVLNKNDLKKACEDCEIVYYLVHSMNADNKDFESIDRLAAQNMKEVALSEGIKRIIFLGGLGDHHLSLSPHLRSRMEVAQILHSGPVPVTTLRAAMIIGNGSLSFELMRYIVEHFPVMITSPWIKTESQPIAIDNVLNYLSEVLNTPETAGEIYDIGGPEILTYNQLVDIYAKEAGLASRIKIYLPFLSPKLNFLAIPWLTPFPTKVVKALAESLTYKIVCQDNRIKEIIPQDLLDCRQAIRLALKTSANPAAVGLQ